MKKKVGVLNLNNNLCGMHTSVGVLECHLFMKALSSDYDFYYFGNEMKKPKIVDYATAVNVGKYEFDEELVSSLDFVILSNGSLNFFGGAENIWKMNQLKILNMIKCKVYFLLTDTKLGFTDNPGAYSNKPWASKYDLDTLKANKDLTYITQMHNISDEFKQVYINKFKSKANHTILDFKHLPVSKIQMQNERLEWSWENKSHDIGYVGGQLRNKSRALNIGKFLFNLDKNIKSELVGHIKLEQLLKHNKCDIETTHLPEIRHKRVSCNKMIEHMSKYKSTLLIGDADHKDISFGWRLYEGILANTIIFVDRNLDSKNMLFDNDFNYISSKEELELKLKKIQNDEQFCKQICNEQYNKHKVDDWSEFKQTFKNIINE